MRARAVSALREQVGRLDRQVERDGERLERLHAAHERARDEAGDRLPAESLGDRVCLAAPALRERAEVVRLLPRQAVLRLRVPDEVNRAQAPRSTAASSSRSRRT